MKADYGTILLLAFLPMLIRTVLYLLAFKFRSIHIKLLNCIIIAGAGYIVGVIPIPLPSLIRMAMTIGLAMFLITRYTEAELFPDVILIPIGVELVSGITLDHILIPLMTQAPHAPTFTLPASSIF